MTLEALAATVREMGAAYAHNMEVIKQGFLRNDIVLEAFRLIQVDLTAEIFQVKDVGPGAALCVKRDAQGAPDLAHYWALAQVNVEKAFNASREAPAATGTQEADPSEEASSTVAAQ